MNVEDVQLWKDKKEREMFENLADLYAIIMTSEKLEKAYVRDLIGPKDYESSCWKLIAQFNTLRTILKEQVPDVKAFMTEYRLECPNAENRLLKAGVPATVEHKSTATEDNSAVAVAETVQFYITAMDCLKLEMKAKDQLYPVLSDLLAALNRVRHLSPRFEGKQKFKDWISKLHNMSASDELDDSDSRQLLFDLETSYNNFTAFLKAGN